MNVTLRPYQKECKRAIKDNYDKGITKQLIVAATGTGKRLMSINISKHFNRTLFIAHREELIQQAFDEIESFWPLQTGIIKAERFEADKKFVIASVQTLHNRLEKLDPNSFDYVIVDEAHHYVSPTYLKSVRHFIPKLLTAWTATPKRLDGLSLSNIVEDIVFEYKIENGIKDGFLAPIEAYQIKTTADISRVKRTAGDFNQKELSEKVDSEERNNLIVSKYEEYCKGRQAIAYCVDIDHSYNLMRAFNSRGISCDSVVSDTTRCPDRTGIVERFQRGEIQVLTNVNILTEGFDYSDVGAVLMARPTQSETLYVQSIGRGTRLKSEAFRDKIGDDKCIILDFVDNTGRLKLVNAYELEKDTEIEDRVFIPQKHKEMLIKEREKRERRMMITHGKDRKVDLLVLPVIKPFNSAKMLEPATPKQLKWLRDIGMYQDDVEYTKAMASEIIGGRRAKDWQIRELAIKGYNVSGEVTLAQYQRVKWLEEQRAKYAMKNS